MTEFLAVLSGIVIALMILVNGDLSAAYGSMTSTVFIHITGLAAICLIMLLRRKKTQRAKVPPWLLCGGVIGVFTTLSNILTFSALGVSLTLALGLLGQSVTSLLIDGFGWFGVERQKFAPRKVAGLCIIVLGAAVMLIL